MIFTNCCFNLIYCFYMSGRYALLAILSIAVIRSAKYVNRDCDCPGSSMLAVDIKNDILQYPTYGFFDRLLFVVKSIFIEVAKVIFLITAYVAINCFFTISIEGEGFDKFSFSGPDMTIKAIQCLFPYGAISSIWIGIIHGICVSWFWWWCSIF